MKKTACIALLTLFCASSVAFANPEILKKHKGMKKDGKMINCVFCHGTAKIEKKKGYPISAVNRNPLCMGTGCHPIK